MKISISESTISAGAEMKLEIGHKLWEEGDMSDLIMIIVSKARRKVEVFNRKGLIKRVNHLEIIRMHGRVNGVRERERERDRTGGI